jgi:hypothetical protein
MFSLPGGPLHSVDGFGARSDAMWIPRATTSISREACVEAQFLDNWLCLVGNQPISVRLHSLGWPVISAAIFPLIGETAFSVCAVVYSTRRHWQLLMEHQPWVISFGFNFPTQRLGRAACKEYIESFSDSTAPAIISLIFLPNTLSSSSEIPWIRWVVGYPLVGCNFMGPVPQRSLDKTPPDT